MSNTIEKLTKIGFDVDKFDNKVWSQIKTIHQREYERKVEQKYQLFLDDNMNHLENMYKLSGLNCGIEVFCSYVFHHSDLI